MERITIETSINASKEKVWKYFTLPEHITQWNNASADWYTPRAENDLRIGGDFTYRMEARDGSVGFDFGGTYTSVEPCNTISYVMGEGGRKVDVIFTEEGGVTHITESFDPEQENPIEMQRAGWQSILNNFKKYVEEREGLSN
jgi:uncharacterized protein YndB with AHSA1/START domain